MHEISLPNKIKLIETDNPNKTILTVEPCFAGYGTTIGNALRRVLLSSIQGAAVTALKIKGVDHEFSTIPGVCEDIVEIILNFKKLRMKVFSDEPVRLHLKAKGEKPVTGGDIDKNADVEIVNKDLVLCNLTDKKAEVDIEFMVKKGRGYVSTEEREKEKLDVGYIAIDSIFTPIKNVAYHVENVRVGQMTNYEKVSLTVETDGTLSAEQAINQACQILINHFKVIIEHDENRFDENTDDNDKL
jgi:DNA-directed RNA polymerase subunit alpha